MSPDVLTGGSWVVVRGVARWVPNQPTQALALVPRLKSAVPVDNLVACPTCRAKVTERCKRTSGNPRPAAHAERLTPRLCACGGLPRAGQVRCPDCARGHRPVELVVVSAA